MSRIGLISDTHGLLRPEAITSLQGCDYLIHGGDIGKPHILDALNAIAPVSVVRGNNDRGSWAENLPETLRLQVGEIAIYAIHDLAQLDIDPVASGIRVIVSWHSHKPSITERNGVLYINPGSAGPRRFKLPISVAELSVIGDTLSARIIELALAKPA